LFDSIYFGECQEKSFDLMTPALIETIDIHSCEKVSESFQRMVVMALFLGKRLLLSKPLYISLGFGLFLSLYHVKAEIIPQLLWLTLGLQKNQGIDFTPYSEWFGTGLSVLSSVFFITLPILASLPFSDTYLKDRQTGYFTAILSKGKTGRYFAGLYFYNFLAAALISAIPLLVNLYFSFMILPDVKPDPIVNNRLYLSPDATFFQPLYYSYPLLHIFFYILLVALFSGMFASLSLSLSFYVNNRFLALTGSFLIVMVLTLVLQGFGKYGWVPSDFLRQFATDSVSFPVAAAIFLTGMLASAAAYLYGVKKLVIP